MNRLRHRAAALIAMLVIATIAGATGIQEPGEQEQILRFGLSGNPDTLDPHATSGTLTFQTIRSFYDTLVEPNRSGELVPALAQSWDVSDDNLVWTFTLRDGVTFHNGDALNSADVKATFERLLDPEIASPKANEFASIEAIEAPDAATVVFRLSEPNAPLLASMASGWGAILPASLIDSGHDFASEPVGTGPFVFVEWVRDSRIVMERNEAYWMDGYPRVDGVVVNIIPESAVQVQALLGGELHAIDSVASQELPMLESNPEVYVRTDLSALVMVLAMNTARDPMDDLTFRRAVAHAIDRRAVMDIAYGGGEPVGTFMDVGDPYYVDHTDLYPYDPARARESLEASGVELDEPLEMALPEIYEPHVRAGEMYQEMLEDVGIDVELRLVDWSTWINDVYGGGNYDFTVIGHTGKLDPDGRLDGYGVPEENYVNWENEEAARAIAEAKRVVDVRRRRELYGRALELMAREIPHVYVGTSYRYVAMRSNVSGFHQDAKLDTFDFRYVEIGE
ncbi:MAG: ABC transporter substrate-binding protein [Spirochaetota bacterium]